MNFSFHYENPLKERFGSSFLGDVPQGPGIYFMLDDKKDILYIGKAKNLKNRISSYFQLKPGQSREHILEMIESVVSIQWNEFSSEEEALLRESELLHAIRPPFNILHTEPEHYLFIGVRGMPDLQRSDRAANLPILDFQLSSHDRMKENGYRTYGCFKHRGKIKTGYSALLRLIYSACFDGSRFSYPGKLGRIFPPWLYSIPFPTEWEESLDLFLQGKDLEFLRILVNQLLNNQSIPKFMIPSIQYDLESVKVFYELGPQGTFGLRRKYKVKSRVVSHSQMDRLIKKTCSLERKLGQDNQVQELT
jgi:hypothetical protein